MYMLGYSHCKQMNNRNEFTCRPGMNMGVRWLDPLLLKCVGRLLPER